MGAPGRLRVAVVLKKAVHKLRAESQKLMALSNSGLVKASFHPNSVYISSFSVSVMGLELQLSGRVPGS